MPIRLLILALLLPACGAAQPTAAPVPTPSSPVVGSFVDQVDPQYAYRMLVPETWEAVDGGDRRIYRSPGEPDAPDRLTLAVTNLKITGEAAKALGGMLAQYAVFERSPTLDGWTGTYFDEAMGDEMTEQMSRPFDLLLGRKTFEI